MSDKPSIHTLRSTLIALRDKQTTTTLLCQAWRDQSGLLTALPPRYQEVMEDLLSRLESGNHFAEESCSYSQKDVLAALADWLNKAESKLQAS
jgi:hypothetical protein